ncbi:hypothetical protein MCOR25_005853 [Pyricularia grisea]|nr:hypothetical protein MCOR25_005853 [Pyricularia grisea]
MSSTQGTFSVTELVGIVIGTTAAVLIIVSVILLSVIRRRRRRRETAGLDWGYQPQKWEETLPKQTQAVPIPHQPVMRQATPPMDLSPIFSPTSAPNLEEALLRAERVNSYPQPELQPYQHSYSYSQTASPTSPVQYNKHHQLPDLPAPITIPLHHHNHHHHQQQQQQQQQQQYIRKETDSISPQSPTYSSPLSPHYSSPQQRFARATTTSNPATTISRQSSTRSSSRRDWPLRRQESPSSGGGFRRLSTLSGRIRGGRHNNESPAELWTTANVPEMDDTQTPRPKAPSFFESPVLGTIGLHNVSIVKPKQSKGSLRTGSARSRV